MCLCVQEPEVPGVGCRDLPEASSSRWPGFLRPPPSLGGGNQGRKGVQLLPLHFIAALGFYAPHKSDMEALDQPFSLGLPAKCMTALPSWDGSSHTAPPQAATPTSLALPGAVRVTHSVRQSLAPGEATSPTVGRRQFHPRAPGLLWVSQSPLE